jgi:hypothetical protein
LIIFMLSIVIKLLEDFSTTSGNNSIKSLGV